METVEDFYTYYVMILEVPENEFWNSTIGFLERITENKSAFDAWKNYIVEKESEC